MRYEDENRSQAATLEEARIEIGELKKHIEIYEEKLTHQTHVREEKINTHLATIQELQHELDQRGKRIRELQREKEGLDKQARDEA